MWAARLTGLATVDGLGAFAWYQHAGVPLFLRALPFPVARLATRLRSYSFLGQVGRDRSPDALSVRRAVFGFQRVQSGEEILRDE